MPADELYEEPTIRIAADSITIKRYYFPLGGSKTILIDDIRSVSQRPANWLTRWRLWGSSNFSNWLPLEMGRPKKHQLIEIDLGGRVKPTITPDDPDRVASLLRR